MYAKTINHKTYSRPTLLLLTTDVCMYIFYSTENIYLEVKIDDFSKKYNRFLQNVLMEFYLNDSGCVHMIFYALFVDLCN